MKKIFAIALALVMVLSMATAFASPCTSGFSWVKDPAATNCGKGKIELVPYVKVNTSCAPYYDYEVSTCAGAVAGEKVFYAIKLTVEANADDEWWNAAEWTLTYTDGGFNTDATKGGIAKPAVSGKVSWAVLKDMIAKADTADKENVFYLTVNNPAWVRVDDDFSFGEDYVFEAVVANPAKAKACAKLVSDSGDFMQGLIGDYYVAVRYLKDEDGKAMDDFGAMLVVEEEMHREDLQAILAQMMVAYGTTGDLGAAMKAIPNAVGYIFADGEVAIAGKYNDKCSTTFYNAVTSFFNINIGTKMDKELINKNFGWEDEVESCFTWSKAAASIVDAECVVAIPKTGDKSVLAWLF